MDNNNLVYLFFSFVLGYLFINIYFEGKQIDNTHIFLYSSVIAFLIFTYQKSIRICGIILLITIYYILKNNK
jgi:hypothetical protein